MDSLNKLLIKINSHLQDKALFYLSNNPERAIGLEKLLRHYFIVHIDKNQYLAKFFQNNINYFCLETETGSVNNIFRSSYRLIKHPKFQAYFQKNKQKINYFQTFKISSAFAKEAENLQGISLNTSSLLNQMFEDKILQYENLSGAGVNFPQTIITELQAVNFSELTAKLGKKFVVQFARGHTGSGTVFINQEKDLVDLQAEFPHRTVRISEFIAGSAFTLNACVGSKATYCGGLSFQITGIPELTAQPGGTVGNDWNFRKNIDAAMLQTIISETEKVGAAMRKKGYLGLFGLDLIVNEKACYLIEVNARQPASIPMFSKLQLMSQQVPLALIHLLEFLKIPYDIAAGTYNQEAMQPYNYSQVFIRAQSDFLVKSEVRMGCYRLQGDNAVRAPETQNIKEHTIFLDEERDRPLVFNNDEYSIEGSNGKILVLAPSLGKMLKPGEEIARIQMPQGATAENGELLPWIKDILLAIKSYQQ